MHFKHLSLAVFTAFFSILGLSAFADSDPAPGYTRLNCIETSASVTSFPYIDSGIAKQDNLYVEFDIARTKASYSYLMGVFASSVAQYLYINADGYVVGRTDGASTTTTTVQAPGIGERFVVKSGWGSMKQTVAIGAQTAQITSTKAVASSKSIPLFSTSTDGSVSTASGAYLLVYGVKMYTGCTFDDNGAFVSGTLVRDFVPCLNDATGKAGLYDRANTKWYGSARNAQYPFGASASQRVNLPANIIRVDYVDTEGAAIDTGLTQQDGYRIDAWARAPATDFSATPCVFGNANFRLGNFVKYSTTVQGSWRAYNGASIDAGAGSNYRAYPGQPFRARAYYSGTKTALYAFDTLYTTKTAQKAVSTTSDTLYLGSYTTTVNAGRALRLYGAKIYTGATGFNDGTLARDYIPAYDLTTEKYGVYDCVNGVFSSSATEGTEFTGASHLMGSIKVAGSAGKAECFWQPNAADDSYGDFAMAHGASRTFTAPTGTHTYGGGAQVIGYRIDTWDGANSQWIEGTFVDSLTCTYTQNYTERKRLAWVWDAEWVKLSTVADDKLVDYSYAGTPEGGYSDGYAVKGAPLTCTVTMKAEKVADMYDFANLSDAWVRKSGTYTIVGTLYPDSNPAVIEIPTPRVVPIQWMDGFFKELPGNEVAVAFTNIEKTHTFTIPKNVTTISRYLVVGGGGGGGGDGSYRLGGGGGAGGLITNTEPVAVSGGDVLTITIGRGGTGGASATTNTICGASSTLAGLGDDTIEALGGGGGGGFQNKAGNRNGVDGGCGGGGAAGSSTVIYTGGKGSQGYDGGQSSKKANNLGGSGGGGAGGPGGNSTSYSTKDGYGGPGLLSDITGEDSYYAAGGGGGGYSAAGACPGGSGIGGNGVGGSAALTYANNGKDATGSGGGGIGYNYAAGGKGGNGVVIIRYYVPPATATVNITNDSDKDEYTATVDGTPIATGAKVSWGATVVVTATPKTGFAYTTVPTDWTAGAVAGTITRDFTANVDPLAIAIPDPNTLYTLTLKTPENGSITGATAGQYAEGTVLELTAEPADGYRFAGWTDDAAGEEDNPLEVTMSADKTIGATFEQLAADERLVTYDGGDNTDYSVKVDGEDVASGSSVKVGKTIVALATPLAHYAFTSTPEGWTACEPSGSLTKSFTVAADDIEFTIPSAAPIMHQLTVTQPTTGSITGTASGSYIDGTAVSLTANLPDETYEFLGWTGDASGTVNPLEFTLTKPTAIGADIRKIARAVTFNTPENAEISVTVDSTPITSGALVEYGKSVVVTSTPAEDFEYLTTPDGWAKSGEAITRTYPVTDQAIDIVIEAPIAIQYYTLTINQPTGGSITGAESGSYKHDTSVTLTATAAAGYKFIHWTGVPVADARKNPLTVKMTEDKTIGAIFRADSVYDQYAQDGLITMWDCKTGYTTEGWKDINGEHQWLFTKVFPESAANGVRFDGTGYGTLSTEYCESTFGLCKKGTMEIVVVREETSGNRCALNVMSTYGSQSLYFYDRKYACAETTAALFTMTEDATLLRSVSIGYNGSGGLASGYIYMNGEKAVQSGSESFTTGSITAGATLGHRRNLSSGWGFKGRILAIRLYSGKLTKEQVIANAKLDRERFLEKVDVSVTCSEKQTYTAKVCGLDIEDNKAYTNNTLTVVATPVAGYVYETTPDGWTQQGSRITKDYKTVNDPTVIAIPEATKDARVAGFMKKVELTLNTALATTEIAGMPTLVRLDPEKIPGFRYSSFRQAKGADMLFTYAGEVIPHEVDTWNTAGESLVWVKLPSTAENTKITMFYGGATTVVNDPTAVWSGYVGVYHMSETCNAETAATTGAKSSTGKYDAVPQSGSETVSEMISTEGKFGNGRVSATTDDSRNALTIPDTDAEACNGTFTFSAWYYVDSASATHYPRLVSRKNKHTDTNGWEVELAKDSVTAVTMRGSANKDTVSATANPALNAGWSLITVVYSGTTVYYYQNGTLIKSGAIAKAGDNGLGIAIGGNPDCSVWSVRGKYDEARLSKGANNANRVAAEYKAMNVGDSDIFTFGKVESKSGLAIIIK